MRQKRQFASVENGVITALHEPNQDIIIGSERIGWRTLLLWARTSPSDLSRRGLAAIRIPDDVTGDVVTYVEAQVGDDLVSSDDGDVPADSWSVRSFTAQELAAYRAEAKQKVKNLAKAEIESLAPEWKQRNTIARGLDLTRKELKGGTLTSSEDDEVTAGEALWAAVAAIRSHSDTVEGQIDSAGTRAAIDALVEGITWP